MNSFLRIGFFAGLLGLPVLHAQMTPTTKLGVGFDYSRGSYGFTTDTEVWSAPLTVSHETHDWAFRASVPWITIEGPASVAGDVGPAVGVPGRPTSQSESGLGDTVLGLTWHSNPDAVDEWKVDLTGRVKLPTADEDKGLGSGETDYYAQIDLYRTYGKITPFGNVGYRFMGKSPAYPLKDGWYASAGVIGRTGAATSVGVAYDWRSRLIDGGPDGSNATVLLIHDVSNSWNIVLYALKGFGDGSPDVGFGGQVGYKF